MRLWHYALIPKLSRQRLLGQHRECCALRGKGWGKKHSTVSYVFDHEYGMLYHYHKKVMREMERRGYKVGSEWENINYRGKDLGMSIYDMGEESKENYPEHSEAYLTECIELLKLRGERV